MRKCFAVAVLALFVACPKVWAQSQCTGYVTNMPQYSLFMPSDWAAQGNVTGGIAIQSSAPGSFPSHNLTQTTTTGYTVTWGSQNVPSGAYATFTVPQSSTHWNVGLSGNWPVSSTNSGPETFIFTVYDSHGVTLATDRVTVTGVSGNPNTIIDQDEIPSSLVLQGQFSFGVPPMTQACQQCIDFPSSCTGANHTPYITARLKNPNTGETKSVSHVVAGNDFSENEYGYGSWTAGVSVLPGDGPEPDPSNPPIGEIFCFAVGADIFDQGSSGDSYTYKTMKTKIKVVQQGSTTAGVTRWYVESWCKDIQHTPIWEPEYIDTKGAISSLISVGQYELSYQECRAEPGWPNWQCPPITVTPPQPLHIGVGGTKYDCSTLLNTPIPQ